MLFKLLRILFGRRKSRPAPRPAPPRPQSAAASQRSTATPAHARPRQTTPPTLSVTRTAVRQSRVTIVDDQQHVAQVTTTTAVSVAVSVPETITGTCYVVDGDTVRIKGISLRLAGIDAPELDHPYGQQAKWHLAKLCKGQVIRAVTSPALSYDRIVATCFLPDGRDLSAQMVKDGLALDWPKFSKGLYGHLEPADARKKHWKAAARQRGQMSVFNKERP